MNTFDQNTGVFHCEDPEMDFTIEKIADGPGVEMFQIDGDLPLSGSSTWPCNETELLDWLGRFFGTNDEAQFRHIIERIKMDHRQGENSEATPHGSFI